MIVDPRYRELVDRLDGWASSAGAFDNEGPIRVTLRTGREVEVRLSRDDLYDMFVAQGSLDSCVEHIVAEIQRLPQDTHRLIYGREYRLLPG